MFILAAMEGPDPYAMVGGLATRIAGVLEELDRRGIETHLFFFGDPARPPVERQGYGPITLHRWGQWLSACHPGGVYHGELEKLEEFRRSLPSHLIQSLIEPTTARGERVVVLAEEWQTAPFIIELDRHLRAGGLRDRVTLLWNANNPYGFEAIDWAGLSAAATILAVSRYMRGILRARGVDSLVAPNGVPERLLASKPDRRQVDRLRRSRRRVLFKMARYEKEKGWDQALDAVVALRQRGEQVALVARSGGPGGGAGGGFEPAAVARGLSVAEIDGLASADQLLDELAGIETDAVSLRFPVTEEQAQVLYAGASGVLANSVSEPFGLVGLEAMAAGGLVFTGGTGEDYAVADQNAMVLESTSAAELADQAQWVWARPAHEQELRSRARETALRYSWSAAVDRLLQVAAPAVARI